MLKSNTNSEKTLDNNNENIKTVEKLLHVKISDSSIILYSRVPNNRPPTDC